MFTLQLLSMFFIFNFMLTFAHSALGYDGYLSFVFIVGLYLAIFLILLLFITIAGRKTWGTCSASMALLVTSTYLWTTIPGNPGALHMSNILIQSPCSDLPFTMPVWAFSMESSHCNNKFWSRVWNIGGIKYICCSHISVYQKFAFKNGIINYQALDVICDGVT